MRSAGIQGPCLGDTQRPPLAPATPLYTPGSVTKTCPHLHTQPPALVSQEEALTLDVLGPFYSKWDPLDVCLSSSTLGGEKGTLLHCW